MNVAFNKVFNNLHSPNAFNKTPRIKSANFNISDSTIKKFSDSVTSSAKAMLGISSKKETPKLPLQFLPEDISRKEVNAKINSFDSYIKKLNPEQKIIKDNYSSEDLLGKLYTADEVIHSKEGFTDSICDCICVLLHNKDDAYLLHLCPGKHKEVSQIKHMQEKISSFVDNLTKDNSGCNAFLFGGREKQSEQLHKNILDVLSNKGIKPDEVLYDKAYNSHSFYYNTDKGIVLDKYLFFDMGDLKTDFQTVNVSKKY